MNTETRVMATTWVDDPETGEALMVEYDRAYLDAIRAFHDSECGHGETDVRRVKLANGQFQVRDCCVDCGKGVGTAKPQKDKGWVASLPWADEALINSYENRRSDERQSILLRIARQQYAERGRFTQGYKTHLASDAWKAKRSLVLKRCGGICEGCGTEQATEVHHLTYRHLGNEFLFELLGLCHHCHDRITEENRARMAGAGQAVETGDDPDDVEF